MTATRSKRSDEELAAMLDEHLLYEIRMLFGTTRAIETLGPAQREDHRIWAIRNALVESFAIHTRNLLDFFYSGADRKEEEDEPSKCKARKRDSDDVKAQDFFDDGETWSEACGPKTQLLATVPKRVAKRIAHLTYARLSVTDEDKPWPYVDIANDIATVLNKFLSVVPDHRVSSSFQQEVSSVLQAQNSVGTRGTAYTSL